MGEIMAYKQNLHTHTVRCDGIDLPEDMIRVAIEKGFDSIGFSGHSANIYSSYHHITPETTAAYQKEIYALKKKYEGQIEIFCGLEYEMLSDDLRDGWEYMIGSTHYLEKDGEVFNMDVGAEQIKKVVSERFGGDGLAFAKCYFEHLSRLPEYGKFDFIGHFDLLTKNIDSVPLFDTESSEYLSYATDAMDALKGKIDLFEVNTGAIARGYRKTPYPMKNILVELNKRGFGAIIASDCHDARYLDLHFDECAELLAECGFKEKYIFTKNGFHAVSLR